MSATGADGFGGWLLAAIGGAMNAERVGPDAAGSVRAELAKFAGAERVQAQRACRNGNRVDAKLADHAGARWAVVAGLDDQAGWRRRLAVIGCLFTGLTPALAVCEQRERGRAARPTTIPSAWCECSTATLARSQRAASQPVSAVGHAAVMKAEFRSVDPKRLRPAGNQVVRVSPGGVA